MGRPLRTAVADQIYHVLNRANARVPLFLDAADYDAFERVLGQACARFTMRLLAYCLMPNHWHLVLWPRQNGDLSRFMAWLTLTHTQRWHQQRQSVGEGHVYQGRFKSFLVQNDEHLFTVYRYVERNALRAKLVKRAEDWRWGSLWWRKRSDGNLAPFLSESPLTLPSQWVEWVNEPQADEALCRVRQSVRRGQPFGAEGWVAKMVEQLGLQATMRSPGRPRKASQENGS
jgi:putative transposase